MQVLNITLTARDLLVQSENGEYLHNNSIAKITDYITKNEDESFTFANTLSGLNIIVGWSDGGIKSQSLARMVHDAISHLYSGQLEINYKEILNNHSSILNIKEYINKNEDEGFTCLDVISGLNIIVGRSDGGLKGGKALAENQDIANKVQTAIRVLKIETPLSELKHNMDTRLIKHLKDNYSDVFPHDATDATIRPYIKALLDRVKHPQSQHHQPSNSIQVLVFTKNEENDLNGGKFVSLREAANYLGFADWGPLKKNANLNASISKHVNDLYRSENFQAIQDLEDAKWQEKTQPTFTHFAVFRMDQVST